MKMRLAVTVAVAMVVALVGGVRAMNVEQLTEMAAVMGEEFETEIAAARASWSAFNLTMRDGVQLWTVFLNLHSEGTWPTVVIRSPYGPDGTENLADLFLPFGFVVVEQNQRGTGQSEGNFTFWSTCPDDEADTISWIKQQSWSNGQVYIMGASADGINAILAMRQQQQELGQWLIFSLGVGYAAAFQGGALKQNLAKEWLKGMQDYRPDAPSYYETVLLPHEQYGDWWQQRTLNNDSTITFPSIFWAGWYDIFLQPMMDTFEGYLYKSVDPQQSRMIIGPRGHCLTEHPFLFPDDRYAEVWSYETALSIYGNGTLPASPLYPRWQRAMAKYLGVDGYKAAHNLERYTLYVMGPSRGAPPSADVTAVAAENTTGMYWTTSPEFPQATTHNLFLDDAERLQELNPATQNSKTYLYNPNNTVPTVGGNNLELACGPHDQRPVENRSDVLVFTTGPMIEDTAVVGRIRVRLFVSSDRVDTDFTVKISDVYPLLKGGDSILIGDSIQRMRWRNGPEQNAAPMEAGEIYEITIDLWPTAYIFAKGHRLRLVVSSSNYPRFSANPNNGLPLDQSGPILAANNTIYFGGDTPSAVELPVVSAEQIPRNVPIP
ncbi:uncharacterized protein MONBRDRAFT_39252 [Monosiga brevicollis MX1]|uniref:Xaa-Pro dipeptidyl-peptidase C-terminal domain-containing protein n=1 Tax=Monosiga brevicollis TaxID=81824 RepID=A9VD89_MONBE|nr:uncharacterized protein MONBRDRAFT_39252 [Monosiga brevicollis MX1]EDQ84487.1 predicted protein [Monosiga brevicollis MX1]|eukprot:XP_001750674.1 hypothetical protein [Monosiga brevicollis MX1]